MPEGETKGREQEFLEKARDRALEAAFRMHSDGVAREHLRVSRHHLQELDAAFEHLRMLGWSAPADWLK